MYSWQRSIDVRAFWSGIDGDWVIKSAEHVLDASGWQTNIEGSVNGYKEAAEGEDENMDNGGEEPELRMARTTTIFDLRTV
ncbi:MAG: hypothetical protein M3Q07_11125 [Pseudobdellovibrionaceae bacterium]|nr:hypothetical protein [Pseudobdellovibrionaceae bacterium]